MKRIYRSRATTGWGFMMGVRRAIKAEPLRANMSYFGHIWNVVDGSAYIGEGVDGPACGTVGCIFGWIGFKAGAIRVENSLSARMNEPGTIGADFLEAVLGKDLQLQFTGTVSGYTVQTHFFNSGEGDRCQITAPGTQEYADAVIERIDRFMKVNEKVLRKHRINWKRVDRVLAKARKADEIIGATWDLRKILAEARA